MERVSADGVRRFLTARVAEGRMPGAAWWVGRAAGGGPGWSRGATGFAEREPSVVELTEATPFDLASLTKPLATAPLAVLLEQQGRIELEAPLARILPETAATRLGPVPLLAFARHEGGLPAWRPLYTEAGSSAEFVAAIARLPRAAEPGRAVYSDLGYLLLGFALERAAGCDLAALFDREIAGPLGLCRTGFATAGRDFRLAAATERGNAYERALAGEAGAGHVFRAQIPRGEVHDANAHALGGAAGHAGLFGTADEVAAIAREILAPARLALGTRARQRLLEVGPAGRSVGFVAARESAAARGILPDEAPGHTGFTGTSVWLDPTRGAVFVLLANRVHPAVPSRGFSPIRRGFHRAAAALAARCAGDR
jgi:CubicO group peptidase (beta-lactamase class C family)